MLRLESMERSGSSKVGISRMLQLGRRNSGSTGTFSSHEPLISQATEGRCIALDENIQLRGCGCSVALAVLMYGSARASSWWRCLGDHGMMAPKQLLCAKRLGPLLDLAIYSLCMCLPAPVSFPQPTSSPSSSAIHNSR
jgi:hypothetical protein